MHSLINQSVLTNYSCRLQGSAGISSTLESKHLKGILLFVCLFLFRSCTDDKHICDCLFVVSTINLLGPGRTEENTIKHLTMFKIEKSESGSGLTQ